MQANHALAARALRVLGFAYAPEPEPDGAGYVERDLIFAGLCGMIDPPREEAKRAVDECHAAGIRPVMITGDHPDTALAIARELGITGDGGEVVSGQRLDQMSDADLRDAAERTSVYARVSAAHKLRIVKAWQGRGQVVAMTGDGVNDAPAVKAADIGIAMGIAGTDVTKEASDMVLVDDNFASIVAAVEEGRGIFDNIQKFIQYLLASNFSEIAFVFTAAMAGWPVPLSTIQILWVNLVTDSLPALALGVEPPERDVMRRPPRPPHEPVITLHRGLLIVIHGMLLAGAATVAFVVALHGAPADVTRARTVAFCTLAFAQLFYSFGCRSQRYTMPQVGAFTNRKLIAAIAISGLLQLGTVALPFMRPLFETAAGLTWEWGLIFVLALAPVTVIELAKVIRWRFTRTPYVPRSA
jgi:Ca2+-transporting ATPase